VAINIRAIFFGNFAVIVGLNPPRQPKGYRHGKKTYNDNIGGVRIRVWNYSTLERRHRYD